jgi:citrate lyase subunit beta / citryl-CoA lyase
MRARRSCISVPGSNPRMLAKASGLPADEVLLDLEDSVVPPEKERSRDMVVDALAHGDWSSKTSAVRINSIDTQWAADDIIAVAGGAGAKVVDCIIVPKVQHAHEIAFVDHLLRMTETKASLGRRIGIEAQIETAIGLTNVHEIAGSSKRLETLVFGPVDMSASLGAPEVTTGGPSVDYPGDQWHWALGIILTEARASGLQAIDGPYLDVHDLDGLRAIARRSRALGYDGKWAIHPTQIDVLNDVYTPAQEAYDRAAAILDALEQGAADDRGAMLFGGEMIDEASRKAAARIVERAKAAGMKRHKSQADFHEETPE